MPYRYQGRIYLPEGVDYDDFSDVLLSTAELSSKHSVLDEVNRRSEKRLPLGARLRVQKIYRASRGYEPGKPRSGEIVGEEWLQLVRKSRSFEGVGSAGNLVPKWTKERG